MYPLNAPNLTKLLAAVTLMYAPVSFAGTKDGGGGGAYVCYDSSISAPTIKYSLLADLWESDHTPFKWPHKTGKIHISYNNEIAAEDQFNQALAKLASLDPKFATQVRVERDNLFSQRNSLDDSISITVPDDLKLGYFPTGCPAQGMMYYNGESEQLDVREDLFSTLRTKTDVAAAWMHEAVYKIMREKHLKENSIGARRLVACLFSDEAGCLSAKTEIPNDRVIFECESPSYKLTVYPKDPVSDPKELLRKEKTEWVIVGRRIGELGLKYAPIFYLTKEKIGHIWFPNGFGEGPLSNYGLRPFLGFADFRMSPVDGTVSGIGLTGYAEGSSSGTPTHEAREDLPCHQIRPQPSP